jgi:uncharacterized protein (TIGR03435 family)
MKSGDPNTPCVGGLMVGGGTFHSTSCTIAWFADRLARFAFQTDVFDKTGLAGVYDFKIDFTPTGRFAPESADSDSGTPSLFTAVQVLGLKLQARKAPMKMVIVDHVEKPGRIEQRHRKRLLKADARQCRSRRRIFPRWQRR